MRRILFDADAVDLGGGVATAAGEGDAAAGDAGTGDAGAGGGEAKEFDWSGALPPNLPDSLKQFTGKKFQDIADSAGNAQAKIGTQGTQISDLTKANAELQKGLEEAKAATRPTDDPAVQAAAREQMEQMMTRYQQATEEYMQTGEVDEEFLSMVDGQPVRVTRDTMLKFMEFQRFSYGNMVDHLVDHTAREDVTKEVVADVMQWLKSGESPYDVNVRRGFDSMYEDGNYAWFDTVLDKYDAAFAGDSADERISARKKTRTKKVRGRPVTTPTDGKVMTTTQFHEKLIAIRSDKSKTATQRVEAERDLIAVRRKQRGEG